MSIRRGPLLVVFALVLGAGPARADWFNDLALTPHVAAKTVKKADKKTAKKPTQKHHVRRRAIAHPPLPQSAPKTAAAKPSATQSIAAKAALPKAQKKKTHDVTLPTPKPDVMTTASLPTDTHGGIPAGEWLKIQSALLWAGDYANIGKDEEPLSAAVKNFQKRHKARVTGMLTIEQRAALLAAGDAHERRYGWRVVTDPATGIRIGLPTKLVPNAHDAAHGTRWSSPHGEVQVETFRLKDPGLKLADLYAQEKKNPRTRRVSRSTLHNDDFSLHGMQGLKYFDVRAEKRDGEIRGFTLLYDQAMVGIVAPVADAMAAAFAPFPARNMPFAVLAKPVEYGTGLIVSTRGDIVTDRQVTDGCKVIVAGGLGNAERVAEDKTHGLALLRVYGRRKLPALPLPRAAESAKTLTLIGIPDPKEQHGAGEPREIKARLAGSAAIRLSQPVPMAGFSGAAVLGEAGQVLGMLETRDAVLASNGPPIAPVHLVTAAAIRGFLEAHNVTPATSGNARDAVVRVICVRK
jgi:hypothetical protein